MFTMARSTIIATFVTFLTACSTTNENSTREAPSSTKEAVGASSGSDPGSFTDWTNIAPAANAATGSLGSVTVDAKIYGDVTSGLIDGVTDRSFTWFSDYSRFWPPLPTSDAIRFRSTPSNYIYTVSFSDQNQQPALIEDPVLYLGSLGSKLSFLTSGVTVEKVSGDSGFHVQGNEVSGDANDCGCTPNDSNGVVRLKGRISSFSFTALSDQSQSDDFYLQIGIPYRLPIVGYHRITQGPGCGNHKRVHSKLTVNQEEAIDYAKGSNNSVVATAPGTVTFAGWRNNDNPHCKDPRYRSARKTHDKCIGWVYGNLVQVEHDDGKFSFYAHLASIRDGIARNSTQPVRVTQNQTLGQIGNTGYVEPSDGGDGSHLHFRGAQ